MTENEAAVLASMEGHGWITPLMFGGTSGSHHSVTATRMIAKKWVERQRRNLPDTQRPSWEYRITPQGVKALHNHLGMKDAVKAVTKERRAEK